MSPRKFIMIGVAAGMACFLLLMFLFYSRSLAGRALPDPNGYEDFLAAMQLLPPMDQAFPPAAAFGLRLLYREPPRDSSELQFLVQENAKALELVRAGMEKEC